MKTIWIKLSLNLSHLFILRQTLNTYPSIRKSMKAFFLFQPTWLYFLQCPLKEKQPLSQTISSDRNSNFLLEETWPGVGGSGVGEYSRPELEIIAIFGVSWKYYMVYGKYHDCWFGLRFCHCIYLLSPHTSAKLVSLCFTFSKSSFLIWNGLFAVTLLSTILL